MPDAGFWKMSAAELLAGYARREFSPVEVTSGRDRASEALGAPVAGDGRGPGARKALGVAA